MCVLPPSVIVAVRAAVLVLAATVYPTVQSPAWLVTAGVSHDAELDAAIGAAGEGADLGAVDLER